MASTCNDDTFGPVIKGCRSNFDFTLLFEQSFFSIGPAILLLILAPPRIVRLLRASKKTIPNPIRFVKSAICVAFVGLQLGLLITWSLNRVTRTTVPSAVLSLLASIAILVLSRLQHSRAVRPSSLLTVYLLSSLALDAVQCRTLYLRHERTSILGLFTASIGIKLLLLALETRSKTPYLRSPYNKYSPETLSGLLNRSFFWWLNPVFTTGFRKLLTLDDLFTTDHSLLSEPLSRKIEKSWAKYENSGKYALVYAVFHCVRWSLAAIIFPRLCLVGFNYAQPFLISTSITFVSQPADKRNKNDGYGLIAATALIYLGISFSTTHYKHHLYRSITAFRGATVSLIYAKTLRLQVGAYEDSAALTLMSTDIDRLATSFEAVCEIWARFIEMVIGIYLLGRQLGWVCVAPVIVVAVSIYCSGKVAGLIGSRQREWVNAIQRRVTMTSSMLGSMKSVKMMGLTDKLSNTLQDQRVRELNLSKRFRIMGLYRMILSFLPPILGPLITFVIFAIQTTVKGSDRLTASQAFSSLAIISLLTNPAEEFLQSLPMIGMATGCVHRIHAFLKSEECESSRLTEISDTPGSNKHNESQSAIELNIISPVSSEFAVIVKNASIRPASKAPTAVNDVTFTAEKGSLTMFIGVVGSGKTSLLKAIIGELKCDTGSISVSSRRMAYCSQMPWLQNATVREIVCGPNVVNEDREWYGSVLHACAFDEDVLALPDQDDTLIGSRGITLSGGQKQRLALARAVYARNEIIVLDDILSAIDARTEKLVVDRLFGKAGIFKKFRSTVILATHAIRHLHQADNIIVLSAEGRILEQGGFDDLRSRDGFVSKILLHPELLENEEMARSSDGNEKEPSETKVMPGPKPIAIKPTPPSGKDDLTRRIGDLTVYKYYIRSIGWKVAFLQAFTSFIYMIGAKFPSLWLNYYSDGRIKSLALFASMYSLSAVVALGGAAGVLHNCYMIMIPKSGAALHKTLLRTVMEAPQSFFDKTDSGVTLNRFSQDMTLVDGPLPTSAAILVSAIWQTLAQFGLIAIGSSYMAATCPGIIIAIYFLQKYYLRTSRQMRFLDLECKSPLYTHFTETIEGISTIRAFGWEQYFLDENFKRLDTSQRPYYLMYCIQRWLNLVLLMIVGVMAVIVMALATSLHNSTSAGRLGVSLSSVVTFNSLLSFLLMFWTQMETSLGAIARLKGFEDGTVNENRMAETFMPSQQWPNSGVLEFKDVSASYGDAPALHNVSFSIRPGEKVGICGRTGSGKSTLLSVLLRILDHSAGAITVDGIDTTTLPRSILRSRILAIPQDPFILAGSVRLNLDPTSSLTDDSIISALTKVKLWELMSSRGGLDVDMSINLLSHGELQIFGLARALLRKGDRESGVLVLDEATSSVDGETDRLMQGVIEEEFKSWTVLCVAHRLGSLEGCDRILVMESGRVVEFDSRERLLQMRGVFWELTSGSGR